MSNLNLLMNRTAEPTSHEWLATFATALHFAPLDPDALLRTALVHMADAVGAPQGVIVLFDEQDGETHSTPRYAHGIGYASDAPEFWQSLIARGLVGFVMHGRRVVIVRNTATDPRWGSAPVNGATSLLPSAPGGSGIGVPLYRMSDDGGVLDKQALIGVFVLVHPQIDFFTAHAAQTLERMSEVLSASVTHALRYESVRLSENVYRGLYERSQREKGDHVRADTLRRDLAAMIYHDLRSPLQNILTSLSGLQRVLATVEKTIALDLVEVSMRSTQQMARMIKGLLDLERLEGGSVVVARRAANISDVLKEAVEAVRHTFDDGDQRLTVDVQPDMPRAVIDPDMIQRVLVNLLENAAKYSPSAGRVIVSARMSASDQVQISVTDTGAGIPPHVRERVFDKFFRVRYQNAPSGFGLGLAFCRLAVEAHGGRIWVESELNVGSTFSFTLPVEPGRVPTAARV